MIAGRNPGSSSRRTEDEDRSVSCHAAAAEAGHQARSARLDDRALGAEWDLEWRHHDGRLHVAHSLWTTGELTLSRSDTGIVGTGGLVHALVGRGGKLYTWNGIGQSLVMVPADIIATGVARALWPPGRESREVPLLGRRLLDVPADRGRDDLRRLWASRRARVSHRPRRSSGAWDYCSRVHFSHTARTRKRRVCCS